MSMEKPPKDGEGLGELIKQQVYRQIAEDVTGGQMPQGTITILFTDVEGSSSLVERLGDDRARGVIRGVDEVILEACRRHDGIKVERAGDSLMLAFPLASAAVACALDIQRTLAGSASGDLPRVRIGLHSGEVIAEERGYFGMTVFKAARVADAARGGQVLVSEVTRLLADPERFRFGDTGEHELKGLSGTHRLFEALA